MRCALEEHRVFGAHYFCIGQAFAHAPNMDLFQPAPGLAPRGWATGQDMWAVRIGRGNRIAGKSPLYFSERQCYTRESERADKEMAMGKLNEKNWKRTLRVLEAIREELDAIEAFEALEAPPEPSTPKERAEWAAFKIASMGQSRNAVVALARELPDGVGQRNIREAKESLMGVADSRREEFVMSWLAERGVSMREMRRPLTERDGLSWMDLLMLDQWE